MEPIGHRRRKSSLISPINPQNPFRERSHSTSLTDEPGIDESKERDDRDSFSDGELQDDEETGLTADDRRRRQKRKRRNTQLDQRIAKETASAEDKRKLVDRSIMKNALINCALIALWYILSVSISLVRLPFLRILFDMKVAGIGKTNINGS